MSNETKKMVNEAVLWFVAVLLAAIGTRCALWTIGQDDIPVWHVMALVIADRAYRDRGEHK